MEEVKKKIENTYIKFKKSKKRNDNINNKYNYCLDKLEKDIKKIENEYFETLKDLNYSEKSKKETEFYKLVEELELIHF